MRGGTPNGIAGPETDNVQVKTTKREAGKRAAYFDHLTMIVSNIIAHSACK